MKSVRIQSLFGPYFPAFGLRVEKSSLLSKSIYLGRVDTGLQIDHDKA